MTQRNMVCLESSLAPAALKLLGSSNPPASASWGAGITHTPHIQCSTSPHNFRAQVDSKTTTCQLLLSDNTEEKAEGNFSFGSNKGLMRDSTKESWPWKKSLSPWLKVCSSVWQRGWVRWINEFPSTPNSVIPNHAGFGTLSCQPGIMSNV